MSKNGSQFIINLVKLPNGYAFDSYHQAGNVLNKKKYPLKDKQKNPPNRTHRIFRQLALDNIPPEDLLNPIPQESEPAPKQVEPEAQEEFSAQIKRQNGLPQSPAKWYNQSSIHQIEKQSLPQFFNNFSYKTESLYLKIRNFIVAIYRKNPSQYLTKIACRRILRGDVNTIMKIHSFLEREGIINFGVSKQGNYTFASSIFSTVLNEQPRIGNLSYKNQQSHETKSIQPIDMTNITITTVNKAFSKSNRVFCSKCNSICGLSWHKKKDQADKNTCLCLQCHQILNETQAQQYIKTDLGKKIQSGAQDVKAVWSIDDNLKLLQFVSKPTQNWQDLQNSFEKKKTFDDIMLQFMQFPIGNFDPTKQKLPQKEIRDSPQTYVKSLMQKYIQSCYSEQSSKQAQQLTNNKFTQYSLALTRSLCKKLQRKFSTNIEIQNIIQTNTFHLLNQKTIYSKKIQNQQISISQQQNSLQQQNNGNNVQKQYDEQSQSNENQRQFNGGANQNQNQEQQQQQQQGIVNMKDQGLQDFIDNFNFN